MLIESLTWTFLGISLALSSGCIYYTWKTRINVKASQWYSYRGPGWQTRPKDKYVLRFERWNNASR